MGYLTLSDYRNSIQQSIFNQLVQNNYAKLTLAENAALDIVISHLTQKYDVTQEFTDIEPWNPNINYNVRTRVIIDYAAWVAETSYNVNDCIINNGIGYLCNTANSDATFIPANWDFLGAQYAIYYASFPSTCTYQGVLVSPTLANPLAPMFDINSNYFLGDVVYWKDNTYVCNMATAFVRPCDLKQYYVYENVPLPNIFPDDMQNNTQHQYWSAGTPTPDLTGIEPTDPAYYILGDNRSPSLVEIMKRIAIWILSDLVVTNNRPMVWEDNYKSSLEKLRGFAEGKTTLRIPLIQPNVGKRVRYGGGIKQQWAY